MIRTPSYCNRRTLLESALGVNVLATLAPFALTRDQAQIAITLDLEMSRNFPTWNDTHWDYEKGNLDDPTKRYALEAGRRVKAQGGRIHYFCVARVLEQENVDWLKELVQEGHPIGNHTYDHVNVKARQPSEIQYRFQRAPWLIEGRSSDDVIADNVRLASRAMRSRLGVDPAGFRTPGGFTNGLTDRPDVQDMLLKQGFRWVSSLYPAHALGEPGKSPSEDTLREIVQRQERAQPFVYPSGLIEIPMSPISDVTAFRSGRWPRSAFVEAIRRAVTWAIEHQAVFVFLAHPSCLVATDPRFETIDLICDLVKRSNGRAELVDLEAIARIVPTEAKKPS